MYRRVVIPLVVVLVVGVVAPTFAGGGIVHATDQEPNDDFETAVAISEGDVSGEIVDGESDFYQLTANTTDALSVAVTNADTLSELSLRVYDADRNQLIGDGNDFGGIDGTIKLPQNGTYYIEVSGQESQTTSNYTLNVDVVTPSENDQFAPNDDFESAASLDEGFSDARIVGGESDFYRLSANSTDAISVDVTSADDLDNLAIRLYNPDRTQLVGDGNAFEGIDYTLKAPETGTYYVEVLGQETQTTSNYTLNVDVVTPSENDQFAPNDDFESAASLDEGFSDARIVGGESDFYRLSANSTDAISVDVTSADDLDNLAIRLYNPDRTQLVGDGNAFEGIDYTLKAPETGTYYIEVLGQETQTTSNYTLDVDVVTPSENDQFAPNDNFDSAAPLKEEFNDARIVGGESDFYKLTLNDSESIGAEIRTAESLDDLAIRLYGPNQTQVAGDGNNFQGLTISYEAPTQGIYYLEIAGQSKQTTSSYELQSNQTFVSTGSVTFTDVMVQNGTETVTVDGASYTAAGSAEDYVVVTHVVYGNGSISDPIGYSTNLSGSAEDITVDLDASGTAAPNSLTENTTLRAMLHEPATNRAFGSAIQINGAAVTDSANITVVDGPAGPGDITGNGDAAVDPDGDGDFEDVNGDGTVDVLDVQALFANQDAASNDVAAFDFNGDGQVDVLDVQALFAQEI